MANLLTKMVKSKASFNSKPTHPNITIIVAYQHEEKYWREFTALFPFAFSGDFSKEKRIKGVEILKIIFALGEKGNCVY